MEIQKRFLGPFEVPFFRNTGNFFPFFVSLKIKVYLFLICRNFNFFWSIGKFSLLDDPQRFSSGIQIKSSIFRIFRNFDFWTLRSSNFPAPSKFRIFDPSNSWFLTHLALGMSIFRTHEVSNFWTPQKTRFSILSGLGISFHRRQTLWKSES